MEEPLALDQLRVHLGKGDRQVCFSPLQVLLQHVCRLGQVELPRSQKAKDCESVAGMRLACECSTQLLECCLLSFGQKRDDLGLGSRARIGERVC